MPIKPLLVLLIASALHAAAAPPRQWKSADGSRSFQGEFLKRDAKTVTLRRLGDTKETVLLLDKLHPDDRTWVNNNHPLAAVGMPDASAVFDELCFGDNRDAAFKKLKASKFVEMTTDEAFIGRSGLNGVFRTRQKIGGQFASLYFDWTGDNQLKEITLQTDPVPSSDRDAHLTPCWKGLIGLINTLHGKPIVSDTQIRFSSVPDGAFSPTHLWKLETGGSAQLGAARDGDKYQIVVRFTKDEIKPVVVQ
jgi:hypothetical protein